MTRNRGVFIGLIAAGVITVVLAVVVVVTLVIPALFGQPGDKGRVDDILGEPQTTWKYEWIGDNNPDFLDDSPDITAVGDDEALVWPVFDYTAYGEAQGTSLGWYEGYDAQYDDGYVAGLAYLEADEAYRNDTFPYTVPPAHEEDFYPSGTYENYDDFLGFHDGFADAAGQLGAGANKRHKPDDPGYTPAFTLLDSATGEAKWSTDVSTAVDGAGYLSAFSAFDIAGSDAVAVVVSSPNDAAAGYTLVTLDKSTGKVLSALAAEGRIDVAGFDGDIIVSTADAEGESSTIGRYATDRLDKDPRWQVTVDGTPFVYANREFVVAYGQESGAVFTGSDGKKATWGDDISYSVFYQFVGDQLVRSESNEEGNYQLQGWSIEGNRTWDAPISAEYVAVLDGSIFTAEPNSDGYSNLQRISPTDGSALWSTPFADDFDAFLGIHGSALLLARGNTVLVLNLDSGTESFTQEVGDYVDLYQGSSLYYVPAGQELVSYGYGAEGEVWSYGLDEGEAITVLGSHLVLVDHDASALYGLAAK